MRNIFLLSSFQIVYTCVVCVHTHVKSQESKDMKRKPLSSPFWLQQLKKGGYWDLGSDWIHAVTFHCQKNPQVLGQVCLVP